MPVPRPVPLLDVTAVLASGAQLDPAACRRVADEFGRVRSAVGRRVRTRRGVGNADDPYVRACRAECMLAALLLHVEGAPVNFVDEDRLEVLRNAPPADAVSAPEERTPPPAGP